MPDIVLALRVYDALNELVVSLVFVFAYLETLQPLNEETPIIM